MSHGRHVSSRQQQLFSNTFRNQAPAGIPSSNYLTLLDTKINLNTKPPSGGGGDTRVDTHANTWDNDLRVQTNATSLIQDQDLCGLTTRGKVRPDAVAPKKCPQPVACASLWRKARPLTMTHMRWSHGLRIGQHSAAFP